VSAKTEPAHTKIAGLTGAQLCELSQRLLPRGAGVARAIYRDALQSGCFDPAAHGLAERTCAGWREHFALGLLEVGPVAQEQTDTGTTAKATLRLADGLEVESVLLPMGRDRATLCISSQVGCKMGCTFCETGRMGLLRHLSAAEIIGQLLTARHRLGWRFRNVVFMGMGEALDNADNVLQALRVMTDGGGLGIAQQHITVCTVGHVDGIARLQQAGFRRLNLSFSLNAASDEARQASMPITRRWPLSQVQRALADYRPRDNFTLGINYCLIPGDNDRPQDVEGIARFCAPLGRVMVNLIPYNPGNDPVGRAPTEAEIVDFVQRLRAAGLPVRRRITKGRDLMAACGQLGNVQLRRRPPGGSSRSVKKGFRFSVP